MTMRANAGHPIAPTCNRTNFACIPMLASLRNLHAEVLYMRRGSSEVHPAISLLQIHQTEEWSSSMHLYRPVGP